jgi:hypothetical protein
MRSPPLERKRITRCGCSAGPVVGRMPWLLGCDVGKSLMSDVSPLGGLSRLFIRRAGKQDRPRSRKLSQVLYDSGNEREIYGTNSNVKRLIG